MVDIDGAQLQGIERALNGLNGAATRLTPLDRHNLFAPLTEFCWWAISADDALREALGREAYWAERDADPDGRVAAGLRHVRNALGHEQLVATYNTGGLSAPFALPITIEPVSVRWLPATGIATRIEKPWNREHYERSVAGRPVDETLYEARRWLERAHAWARTGTLLPGR